MGLSLISGLVTTGHEMRMRFSCDWACLGCNLTVNYCECKHVTVPPVADRRDPL